ncbi:MAG: hypothetical protein ACE5KV_04580, partial [Thermoplasmata archaeon]
LSPSYSTSAKTGSNVEKAFESLGHFILSENIPSDPIKEMYEALVAMGIQQQTEVRTPLGALDAIFVDVCEEFDDDRLAMSILRQEISRAGIDIRSPSKEGLLKVVEYLAEAESEYRDTKIVLANKERRMKWVRSVRKYE